MKQIILITDGCSNLGENPIQVARRVRESGIILNVIGVMDRQTDPRAIFEVEEMAKAGGGMSRVVNKAMLSQTVQMMTRHTVAHTIKQVVNHELQQIFGQTELDHLPPGNRAEVVEVIEHLSEHSSIMVALLVDTSASMKTKILAIQEATYDLMVSLNSREGASELSVFHYPTSTGESLGQAMDWTANIDELERIVYQLQMSGMTPTGPALASLIPYFNKEVTSPIDTSKELDRRVM